MSATSVDVAARGSCPQCGAGLPLGRGGGTVTCAFCHLTSTYTVVPAPAASSRRDELQAIAIIPLHASRGALVAGWSATTLEAYDPGGGQPGWTVTLPRTSQPIVTSFERLYVPTDTDELIAIDAATGRIAFVAALPGPTSQVDGFPCVADVCGPSQAHACVLVHAGGQLVALDRMSGAEVARWAVEPPRCWATAIGYVLVGPVAGEVWLVDPMRAVPLARVPVATDKGLGGVIASGHAFVTGGTDDHTAIQLADGALAWRAAAPWDPATGTGAAFARELFVADGTTITALPGRARVETPGRVEDLRMIAGTVIATAGARLLAYQRTLTPIWELDVRDFDQVRIADNGRMLVVALDRGDQRWLRGLLPTTGKARWNVLLPETSPLVRHAVVGDLVMIETEHQRCVLRADTGQVVRIARR